MAEGTEWQHPPSHTQITYKIGIYGWRKRCLYLVILILMAVVIINLALTIWILKIMNFSIHGMGKLRITENGVRVEGDTEFLKTLHTSNIRSIPDKGINIESARNITINARNSNNKVTNRLFLGDQKVTSYGSSFEIRDRGGNLVFSANDREVFVGANQLTVSGATGATFSSSLQTPLVRPEGSQPLRLESPTKSIYITAPKGVNLKAPVGDISIQSLADIKLTALKGALRINATNISVKNLYISSPRFDGKPYPEVYQLCVCARNTGRLFVSPARGNCQATSDVCN